MPVLTKSAVTSPSYGRHRFGDGNIISPPSSRPLPLASESLVNGGGVIQSRRFQRFFISCMLLCRRRLRFTWFAVGLFFSSSSLSAVLGVRISDNITCLFLSYLLCFASFFVVLDTPFFTHAHISWHRTQKKIRNCGRILSFRLTAHCLLSCLVSSCCFSPRISLLHCYV